MLATVTIGDKEVRMMSMASCDRYYKNCFGEDPIMIQSSPEWTDWKATELMMGMGFIMAKFAEHSNQKDMLKLNEEAYLEWLDQFDRADYIEALTEIMDVYNGTRSTTSTPKKEEDQ